ncbi:MAG: hypothetical protein A2512_05540 [Deltaproteobacteria bacterium RIFOXYD12_FULL_56_24]|nr:MAG: hypothetical protein A2512_05540 [Deltaproteobacteria bacterium RIFOXYD12_FULL_56_24]
MKTQVRDTSTLTTALEKAAKHICTARCGRCPHVVEQYPCPKECNLDTIAWECWMQFFLEGQSASS